MFSATGRYRDGADLAEMSCKAFRDSISTFMVFLQLSFVDTEAAKVEHVIVRANVDLPTQKLVPVIQKVNGKCYKPYRATYDSVFPVSWVILISRAGCLVGCSVRYIRYQKSPDIIAITSRKL